MTNELDQAGSGRRAENAAGRAVANKRAKAAFSKKSRRGAPGDLSILASRLVLFWEQLWPVILATGAPFFLIIVASLFGVWTHVPAWGHWLALGAASLAAIYALWRTTHDCRWPTRRQAQARLEENGAARHAPLQALDDTPFGARRDDPFWRAHLKDMKERARQAALKGPRSTADAIDPYALRFGALGLLAVALVAAGDQQLQRIADGFRPTGQMSGDIVADLWIEPPDYTGKSPIYLLRANKDAVRSGAGSDDADFAGLRDQIDAPEGSTVIAQINGTRRYQLVFSTSDEDIKSETDAGDAAARATLTLPQSGVLKFRLAGREARWPVGVISDEPPHAAFIEPPSTTDDARLALALSLADDYGIAKAALHLKLDPDQERPLDAPAFNRSTLDETRIIPLDGLAGASGERRFDLDLQSDPWAGLAVIGKLVVRDGADQEAETSEETFRLPARPFYNPLARAVLEQRQTLAVAADEWRRAGRSFDALTLAPEKFYSNTTDYLLIRTAFWRVMQQSDETQEEAAFDETVEDFWPLALQLEDEALELARRRLEAARDALRQALENGGGDQEIERLTQDLREAMNQYLEALANSGQQQADSGRPPDQQLDQSDLDQMLDSIRDLAKSGARDAARQALSELENILDNLRLSGQPGEGRSGDGRQGQRGEGGESGEAGGAAGQAGDLIGRQRGIANESFERGQSFGEAGDDLAERQGELAGDLADLMQSLENETGDAAAGRAGQNPDPDGEAARAFSNALSEMRRSENALAGDNFDAANTAMERAIANLREGAETLAREQGRARESRGEEGENQRAGPATDPLGRPIGDGYGDGVDVPEASDAQRAREVLEELRRRLSDGERTEEEIEYLERLLDRF